MSGDYEVCNVQRDIDAVPRIMGEHGSTGWHSPRSKGQPLGWGTGWAPLQSVHAMVHAHHHNPIATLARSPGRIHVSIARAT
jgi:hypothetical protein